MNGTLLTVLRWKRVHLTLLVRSSTRHLISASKVGKGAEMAVVYVNGSSITYHAEVEGRTFNSSGDITERIFEVHIESAGKEGNGDGIAGIAHVETKIGEDNDFNAGIATVTAIGVINSERTPTNDNDV